jgi:galactose-1-phosphate uridylyltransferase
MKPKINLSADLASGDTRFIVHKQCLVVVSSHGGRGMVVPGSSFIEIIPIYEAFPFGINYLPKSHLLLW